MVIYISARPRPRPRGARSRARLEPVSRIMPIMSRRRTSCAAGLVPAHAARAGRAFRVDVDEMLDLPLYKQQQQQ